MIEINLPLLLVTVLAIAAAAGAAGYLFRETRISKHRLTDLDREALLRLAERRRPGRLS